MKLNSLVTLAALLISAPSFADSPGKPCFRHLDDGDEISYADIQAYIKTELSALARNEVNTNIEACVNAWMPEFDWYKLRFILSALTAPVTADQDRIVTTYFRAKISKMITHSAVEVVQQISSLVVRNQLLVELHEANRRGWLWFDVNFLISNLAKETGDPAWDRAALQERLSKQFITENLEWINAFEVVEVGGWQLNALDGNRVIEEFFLTRIEYLDWEEVKVLFRGLRETDTNEHYDNQPTEARIRKAWAERQSG